MRTEDPDRLFRDGLLSELDLHFSRFMIKLSGSPDPYLALAASLVSNCTGKGHICLDLAAAGGKALQEGESKDPIICPQTNLWVERLSKSPLVGRPGDFKPLILDDKSRLYLYRYWDYERKLSDIIRERAEQDCSSIDFAALAEGLKNLFPIGKPEYPDWQKLAAFSSIIKKFCVISGGPGSGKTSVVARILVLFLLQAKERKLRIALAAPTGKAAARLREAIKKAKEKLNYPHTIKDTIPEEASTIHRLLGPVLGSPYFRHNAKNPLPVDVIVVDEASMIDLPLMSKLTQALLPDSHLILLGDKDQLASVEAGAVLGDICDTKHIDRFSESFCRMAKEIAGETITMPPTSQGGWRGQDCIIQLKKSHRFDYLSGIGAVSAAVNSGESERALAILRSNEYPDIGWSNLPRPEALIQALRGPVISGFKNYLKAVEYGDPRNALELFDQFRILCGLREGPYGIHAINVLVERILAEASSIRPQTQWYQGRPVLITRNDYTLRLFNGDVGVIMRDQEAHNELRAFFPAPEGKLRKLPPIRLPEHETAYAITVHRSQGSEFNMVLFLLPERDALVLTRELIYTAITRAKERAEVWGKENVFLAAVCRRIVRTSGLRDALWA
jgi:exodeoxyribonuclease V alpha subunit